MTFYRLTSPDGGENIMMDRDSHEDIFDTSGKLIDTTNLDLPFKIQMHAGDEYGYDQYNPFFEGEIKELSITERLVDYYSLSSLMSDKLVNLLVESGVDNIQIFPIEIEDASTGEVLNFSYSLVNIVGLVSCAKMDESEHSPIGNSNYFHELQIDEKKTNGQLIFRLAESRFEVIVHEKIAKLINEGGFTGLVAVPCS